MGVWGFRKESVVFDDEALKRQIQYVIEMYHQPALVEEFVDGRELNVGLLETNGKVGVLPISEIDYSEFPEGIPKICGYEAKWMDGERRISKIKTRLSCSLGMGGAKEGGAYRRQGL